MDLDTMWCREFTQMMQQRKAMNAGFDLKDLPLPENALGEISQFDKVYIRGIEEEYFSELNDTEASIWNMGKLYRRKFDYKGEYIRDKDGKYITVHVPVPNDCIAVMSDKKIGVPTKFKSKEDFEYVDMIQEKDDDGNVVGLHYVYIVPREYCYKLSQTALVASIDKLRIYYEGVAISATNGYTIFLYTIPYRPTRNKQHRYRILKSKTSIDYTQELQSIYDYWSKNGIMFPKELCETQSGFKGKSNMAVEIMPIVLDEYVRYDENKSMSSTEEDMDNLWEGDY